MKPLLFLSHDSRDKEIALAFGRFIQRLSLGLIDFFCSTSVELERGIGSGDDWYNTIVDKLAAADRMICFLTPCSRTNPWVFFEAGYFKGRATQNKVVSVLFDLEFSQLPAPLARFQNCLCETTKMVSLVESILSLVPEIRTTRDVLTLPTAQFVAEAKALSEKCRYRNLGFPDLSGDWDYLVMTPDGLQKSHSGTCRIGQAGRKLSFRGTRHDEVVKSRGIPKTRSTSRAWHTSWAEICEDGHIRACYEITLAATTAKAVFSLHVQGSNDELEGEYFLLPPFTDDVLNAKNGHIIYRRSSDKPSA